MTSSRIYYIQSFPTDFYTGSLPDGTQVFVGMHYPYLVAVLFDGEGNYLRTWTREISKQTQAEFKAARTNKEWINFSKDLDELESWREEMGLVEGRIGVQKFSLPEYNLAIEDLPEIYRELRASGRHVVDDLEEQIQYWQQENDYVLVWGREYDMDKNGEVIST